MTVQDDRVPYAVQLPDFEGPLDLLLHLVKKHELDILNIPIAFITDQYLKMLEFMHSLNLDVAGEYLLMAATLAHLKSRELVPPDPSEQLEELSELEEGELLDPRAELVRRLLEYQKYKDAAEQLGDRPTLGRNVWARGIPLEELAGFKRISDGAPLAQVPVIRLVEALDRILAKAKVTVTHDVAVDRVSIGDAILKLVDRIEQEGTFTFESCFEFLAAGTTWNSWSVVKGQVVVTFLALLEMTRLKLIRMTQEENDETGAIYVSRFASPEELRAHAEQLTKTTEQEYM